MFFKGFLKSSVISRPDQLEQDVGMYGVFLLDFGLVPGACLRRYIALHICWGGVRFVPAFGRKYVATT